MIQVTRQNFIPLVSRVISLLNSIIVWWSTPLQDVGKCERTHLWQLIQASLLKPKWAWWQSTVHQINCKKWTGMLKAELAVCNYYKGWLCTSVAGTPEDKQNTFCSLVARAPWCRFWVLLQIDLASDISKVLYFWGPLLSQEGRRRNIPSCETVGWKKCNLVG